MKAKTTYKKVSSYEGKFGEVKKMLLLYSGGLDTSVILKWIQDTYKAEVVTLTLDVGQQKDKLEEIRQKALKFGATKAIVKDIKDLFAEEYISKGIKANADYQGGYHLSTPMGRAVMAKIAVDVAKEEALDCMAHGCTGKGNDQVRFETYILAHDPGMKIIAPVREWDMDRDAEIKYAKKNGIPVPTTVDVPYSDDDNMWGMTWEGGEIEEPDLVSPVEKFLTTYTLSKDAPDQAEVVTLTFSNGIPTSINGDKMKLSELISKLNKIGGRHGVGVAHMFEDRLVGVKNGGVYEQPAARIIIDAHKALEKYVSTRELNKIKAEMDSKWAYLCYDSHWFDPSMEAINAFNDFVNKKVEGEVAVQLFKGTTTVVAMNSRWGLDHASFNNHGGIAFNVNASAGFIEIYGLQMKLAKQLEMRNVGD